MCCAASKRGSRRSSGCPDRFLLSAECTQIRPGTKTSGACPSVRQQHCHRVWLSLQCSCICLPTMSQLQHSAKDSSALNIEIRIYTHETCCAKVEH